MDSDRWQRIQALFHEAVSLPESDQRIFLESRCADDPKLVSEVLILLDEDARSDSV